MTAPVPDPTVTLKGLPPDRLVAVAKRIDTLARNNAVIENLRRPTVVPFEVLMDLGEALGTIHNPPEPESERRLAREIIERKYVPYATPEVQ